MKKLQIIALLLLIGLASCNPADKKSVLVASQDTASVLPPTIVVIDSSQFALDTTNVSGFYGDTAEQIDKTLKLISALNKTSVNFPRDTFSVDEMTTEGCEIIVTHDGSTEYVKFYGTLFGEMGKLKFSFYALNEKHPKIFCTIYDDISYDKPMYLEDVRIRETRTTYEIYYDNKIIAVLDGNKRKQHFSAQELKTKETETRQFFRNYIGQIRGAR